MGAGKSQENIYQDPTLNAQLFDQTKQCKFYRNQNGQQFEKYRVRNSGNNDFQNRYQYRIKHHSPYLVNAFSAKTSQNAFGCTSGDQYQVVTQRIPIRLCDINNLPGPQALNMVHKALKGFQQIYKSQGVILVKDSMIGVNQQNNVRVWMNSNFAVNQVEQPPISYGVLSDYEKQSTLVDNIIQLVNSRSKRDHQWVGFVQEKYKQGRIGFDQAIQLSQMLAERYNIILADYDGNKFQLSHHQNQFSSNTHQYEVNNSQIINNQHQHQHQLNKSFDSNAMMKSTTQTIGTPINLNSQSPALNVFTPQSALTQSIPNVRLQTGISNIRNKIVNKNSQVYEQNPHLLLGAPIINHELANSSSNFSNNIIQAPNPQSLPTQTLKNQPFQVLPNFQNRTPISSASTQVLNRHRSHSQGKPIITFGNRPYNPSPQSNLTLNQKNYQGNPVITRQVPQVNQFQNLKRINDQQKEQSQQTNQKNTNSKPTQTSNSNLNSLYVRNQIQDAKNVQLNGQIKFNTQQARQVQQLHPQIQQRQQPQVSQSHQLQKQIQNPFQILNQNNKMVRQLIIQQDQQPNKNNINYHQIQIKSQSGTQGQQLSQAQQLQSKKLHQNQQKIQIQNPPKSQHQQPQIQKQQQQINTVQLPSQVQVTQVNYSYQAGSNNNNRHKTINYPPPNQVINYQRKIEINDSKQRVNPQVTQYSQIIQRNHRTNDLLFDSKVTAQEPKIRINQIHSDEQEQDNRDSKLLKSQVSAVQYSSKDKRQQHNVKRTQTFGADGSFGVIPHMGGANQHISQNKDRNSRYFEDSPMFGKGKESKVSQSNSQATQNKRETHIDQLLALQEEKLYMIKSKESEGIQKSIQGSIVKKQSIKQIKNESQDYKILNQNKIMTNSKQGRNKSEQETTFKKAVKQTASNIRLETSKVSIRSSSDLKGIISYKDLRDLLKSTKKPLN